MTFDRYSGVIERKIRIARSVKKGKRIHGDHNRLNKPVQILSKEHRIWRFQSTSVLI
jgi:hypothetical protein